MDPPDHPQTVVDAVGQPDLRDVERQFDRHLPSAAQARGTLRELSYEDRRMCGGNPVRGHLDGAWLESLVRTAPPQTWP
jgi:hypothetical protein